MSKQNTEDRKLKVLMIETFLPENTYTLELGRELSKHVDLVMACRKGAAAEDAGNITFKDFLYRGGQGKIRGKIQYAISLLCLEREIRKGHYDVVHVQYFQQRRVEMPIYLRKRNAYGILAHTVHDVLPHEAKETDRALFKNFYAHCDLLAVHNRESMRILHEEYGVPEKKCVITPMGGYKFVKLPKKKKGPDDPFVFLQFGQIRRYKAVDVTLHAVALLPKEVRQKIRVIIAGKQYPKLDGTDYKAMAKDLGILDCVEFRIAYIPEEEIPELFSRADFCLVPYRELYGSASLMMAYTYEKPVIASNLPILKEETDGARTGILFENENASAMASAMQEAMRWTPAQYETCRKNIEALVRDKYNFAISAKKLADAYKKAIEEKGR